MSSKVLDLFQAYNEGALAKEGGYIVSSFFDSTSTYSIYEIVAYSSVKNIYLTEEGLTFQTDGNKLYVLVEPPSFNEKFIEPVSRKKDKQIPHRFKELDIYTDKNQTKIMVSHDPIITYSSFTVLRPTGVNFALLFFNRDDIMDTMDYFFTQTLNKEAGVPKSDARKASKLVVENLKKFSIW